MDVWTVYSRNCELQLICSSLKLPELRGQEYYLSWQAPSTVLIVSQEAPWFITFICWGGGASV